MIKGIHIISRGYSRHTRMIIGIILMVSGILLSKLGPAFCDIHWVHILFETVGTLINGIGATPFVEECL